MPSTRTKEKALLGAFFGYCNVSRSPADSSAGHLTPRHAGHSKLHLCFQPQVFPVRTFVNAEWHLGTGDKWLYLVFQWVNECVATSAANNSSVFTITEKAPVRLKAATRRHNYHKGHAALRIYTNQPVPYELCVGVQIFMSTYRGLTLVYHCVFTL